MRTTNPTENLMEEPCTFELDKNEFYNREPSLPNSPFGIFLAG